MPTSYRPFWRRTARAATTSLDEAVNLALDGVLIDTVVNFLRTQRNLRIAPEASGWRTPLAPPLASSPNDRGITTYDARKPEWRASLFRWYTSYHRASVGEHTVNGSENGQQCDGSSRTCRTAGSRTWAR